MKQQWVKPLWPLELRFSLVGQGLKHVSRVFGTVAGKDMARKIGIGLAVLAVLCVAGAAVLTAYVVHQVEGAYFDSDGVRLHYTEDGSGEPVVLVHGFAVNADVNWRKPGIIRALAKDYRVIAPEDGRRAGLWFDSCGRRQGLR